MKTFKEILESHSYSTGDLEYPLKIQDIVKEWLKQKKPKKQSKSNVWTSSEYEQDAFIDNLLEELNEG